MAIQQQQIYKNFALLALSIVFLPFNLYLLLACLILSPIAGTRQRRPRLRNPKKYLVIGVNSTFGLTLARNLHLEGGIVIGVDNIHLNYGIPGIGRFSRALRKVYSNVPGRRKSSGITDHVAGILKIVRDENIDFVISCDSTTTASEDAVVKAVLEKETRCKMFAFQFETASKLFSRPAFLELTKSIGLSPPELYTVSSRDQMHKVLNTTAKKHKDKAFTVAKARSRRISYSSKEELLPKRSLSHTYQAVSELPVSGDDPYILEEYITGDEYCSYVLLVDGAIDAFSASHAPQGSRIRRLSQNDNLYHAILRLTKRLIQELPTASGPLTISFVVQLVLTSSGYEKKLVPRDCSAKIGLPSLLLRVSHRNMVAKGANGAGLISLPTIPLTAQGDHDIYFLASDFMELVLRPLYDVLRWRMGPISLWKSLRQFIEHILYWKEATFELYDPLPFLFLYSVWLPTRLAMAIIRREEWTTIDLASMELRYD